MATNDSVFKWETLLADEAWDCEESLEELLPSPQAGEARTAPTGSRVTRTFAAVAVSMLLVSVFVLWLAGQRGVSAIDAELQDMVEVESWLQGSENITATASFIDAEADPAWQSAYLREMELSGGRAEAGRLQQAFVERTRLRSGLAMVQVTLAAEDGDAYRETRFYRETATGWQRTSPDDAFWGREQVLETDRVRFGYRQADAQAVIAAAPQLDRIYEQLRADLGLTGEPDHLAVQVEPVTLESLGSIHFRDGSLTVPSPLLLHRPIDVDDDTMLVQSVVYPLVMQAWEEADARPEAEPWRGDTRIRWEPMTRGVQIWLSAATDEPTAQWLSETAAWLYAEVPEIRSGLPQPLVADREILCGNGSLWQLPTPITVNSWCKTTEWEAYVRWMPPTPHTLRQFLAVDERDPHPLTENPSFMTWQRVVAAATVVDYFVQAYGREQLSELVAGFRTHDSWETLIPDVTGDSAAEFEAGWQQFLADEYRYEETND